MVTSGFVVDGEAMNHGTRWVRKFSGGDACAVNDKSDVVVNVELSAFDLLPVADANPASHPVGAAELLDLHEGRFLS